MFTTYDALKCPVQVSEGATTWSAVEMELGVPWFVAKFLDQGSRLQRTFLLLSVEDVLEFARDRDAGDLTQLRLVLPPAWSGTQDWQLIRVFRVEVEPSRSARPMVLTEGGTRYGGFPLERLDCADRPLMTLMELSDA